jgi:hypothetical protein
MAERTETIMINPVSMVKNWFNKDFLGPCIYNGLIVEIMGERLYTTGWKDDSSGVQKTLTGLFMIC